MRQQKTMIAVAMTRTASHSRGKRLHRSQQAGRRREGEKDKHRSDNHQRAAPWDRKGAASLGPRLQRRRKKACGLNARNCFAAMRATSL